MALKKPKQIVKLEVPAGAATPGPPVGAVLGSKGIKAMDFCTRFNAQTQDRKGQKLPVHVYIYEDRTFDFIVKQPTARALIMKAAGLEKGSAEPNRKKVATLTSAQLKEIALTKKQDTNAFDLEAAQRMLAGTARSMGITITS